MRHPARILLIALAVFALLTRTLPLGWLLSPVAFIVLVLVVSLARPSTLIARKPDIWTDLLLMLGACLTSAPAFGVEPLLIAFIPFGAAAWWSTGQRSWRGTITAFLVAILLAAVVWRPLTLGLATLSLAPYLLAALLLLIAWRWERLLGGIGGWVRLFRSRKTVFLGVTGGAVLLFGLVGVWRAFSAIILGVPLIPWLISAIGLLVLLWLPTYLWYAVIRVRQDSSRLPDWPAWLTGLTMALALTAALSPVVVFTVGGAHATLGVAWSDLLPGAIVGALIIVVGMMNDYLRRMLMILPFLTGIIALGTGLTFAFVEIFFSMDAPGTIIPGLLACGALVVGFVTFLYEIWRD